MKCYLMNYLILILKRLCLNEDILGATFMAGGSSTPEVFISLIGVFFSQSNIGVGTIVGSSIFNILFVIGLCAIFVNTVKLTLFRIDLIYKHISCLSLLT
jgi:solute carrier family 24 (sodium/potassium/calcium exchanger), member 4